MTRLRVEVTLAERRNGEDDDDDDVVAEQAAAATQQVLQRARPVSPRLRHQEPARRLRRRAGRPQGGRDARAALRQLSERDERTL